MDSKLHTNSYTNQATNNSRAPQCRPSQPTGQTQDSSQALDSYTKTAPLMADSPKDLQRRLLNLCQPRDPQPKLGPDDHPSVFFTLANGRVITAATAEQVKEIAHHVGDGQIIKMVAQGHGCDSAQFLGAWDKNSRQGFILKGDGHIALRDSQGQDIGDFSKLFGKKFRSQHSLIVFQGCYTARDNQKNLSKATSEALPGVAVIGNVAEGWGWGHVFKTDRQATVPPLAAGGYSTSARQYYNDPGRHNHHARLVDFYEDDILR